MAYAHFLTSLLCCSLITLCSGTTCADYSSMLSHQISTVSECFSTHVSPSSLCGWCYQAYQTFEATVQDKTAKSPSGDLCIDIIFVSDMSTIDLIQSIRDVWEHSFCLHCLPEHVTRKRQNWIAPYVTSPVLEPYTRNYLSDVHIEGAYNINAYNNLTREFFDLLDETLACFSQHILNQTIPSVLDTFTFPPINSVAVNHSVCVTCNTVYHSLLDFYNKQLTRLREEHTQSDEIDHFKLQRFAVCMDIQYALNRTQWAWFNLLQCRLHDQFTPQVLMPFFVCIIVFILFHLLSYFVFRRPVRVWIYQPKRVQPRIRRTGPHRASTSSLMRGEQLSCVPSYGSFASSSFQQVDSVDSNTRLVPGNNRRSRLLTR